MDKIVKVFIAALLFLCLINMPYGYYTFVRYAACISFGYFAYTAKEQKREGEMVIYIALAILFQPFLKVSLGRLIWNIADVIIGLGLIISAFSIKSKK